MPEGCPEPHPDPRRKRATRTNAVLSRTLKWTLALALAAFALPALALLEAAPETAGAEAGTAQDTHVVRDAPGKALDPREFEPGACVEYPPSSGDRKLTVFLDAGHGGLDPGGVGSTESGQTIYEKDETLPVELDAMELLRAKGFTVVVSRTRDETVSRPAARRRLRRSLHRHTANTTTWRPATSARTWPRPTCSWASTSTPEPTSYNAGSVTGYDTDRSFSAQSLRLATLVQTDVLGAMNAQGWAIPDEGVVDDSELGGPALTTAAADYGHLLLLGPAEAGWFTTPSTMPGALIEPLFITDPFEATLAASAQGEQVIAEGLAQAVEQYFAPNPNPSADTGQNSEAAVPHHGHHKTRRA